MHSRLGAPNVHYYYYHYFLSFLQCIRTQTDCSNAGQRGSTRYILHEDCWSLLQVSGSGKEKEKKEKTKRVEINVRLAAGRPVDGLSASGVQSLAFSDTTNVITDLYQFTLLSLISTTLQCHISVTQLRQFSFVIR